MPTRCGRSASVPAGCLTEIEKRGVGQDRVFFASDEPWSDFWGEHYKIAAANVSQELKERVLHGNFEELYGTL
jgi:predicted TIM-barrel fold metal-dependent hydrolase